MRKSALTMRKSALTMRKSALEEKVNYAQECGKRARNQLNYAYECGKIKCRVVNYVVKESDYLWKKNLTCKKQEIIWLQKIIGLFKRVSSR